MALIDDLLDSLGDDGLGNALRAEVERLRQQKAFGLVFERHIPELAVVVDAPVRPGDRVRLRDSSNDEEFEVEATNSRSAVIHSLL